MHFTMIVTAIGLGIAYAAAPGAVNTEAIRQANPSTHNAMAPAAQIGDLVAISVLVDGQSKEVLRVAAVLLSDVDIRIVNSHNHKRESYHKTQR